MIDLNKLTLVILFSVTLVNFIAILWLLREFYSDNINDILRNGKCIINNYAVLKIKSKRGNDKYQKNQRRIREFIYIDVPKLYSLFLFASI